MTRIDDEIKKLKDILVASGVSEKRQKMLEPIIENVAWMQLKLDTAREMVRDSSVAIYYDNGGGQTGLRENPAYKGYEALWKSYLSGMEKILEVLPKEIPGIIDEEQKPATVLELVRKKHKEA